MKQFTIFATILALLALAPAYAAAQQLNVTTGQDVGVTANPVQQVLIGGSTSVNNPTQLPTVQPNFNPMTSPGFVQDFAPDRRGGAWNIGSLVEDVFTSKEYTRSQLEALYYEAGGDENLLIGTKPFSYRRGGNPNDKVIFIFSSQTNIPLMSSRRFVIHGIEGIGKLKKATTWQVYYATGLEALIPGQTVVLRIKDGYDPSMESRVYGKTISGSLGLTSVLPGFVAGFFGASARADQGQTGPVAVPAIQASVCPVSGYMLKKVLDEKTARLYALVNGPRIEADARKKAEKEQNNQKAALLDDLIKKAVAGQK